MATFASDFTSRVDLSGKQVTAFTISRSRLDIAADVACDNPDDCRQRGGNPALPDQILLKDRIILSDHDRPGPIMAAGLVGQYPTDPNDKRIFLAVAGTNDSKDVAVWGLHSIEMGLNPAIQRGDSTIDSNLIEQIATSNETKQALNPSQTGDDKRYGRAGNDTAVQRAGQRLSGGPNISDYQYACVLRQAINDAVL